MPVTCVVIFNDSDVIVASLAVVCTPSSRWSLRTVDKGSRARRGNTTSYVPMSTLYVLFELGLRMCTVLSALCLTGCDVI